MGRAPPGDARRDNHPPDDVEPRRRRHRDGTGDRVDRLDGAIQGREGCDVGDEGRHLLQRDEHAGHERAEHHDERRGAVGVLALNRVAARQADECTERRQRDDDRGAGRPRARRHLRAGSQANTEADERDERAQRHQGREAHKENHPRLDGRQRVHARNAGCALDGQRRAEGAAHQDDAVRGHHDDHRGGHVAAPGLRGARGLGHAEYRVHKQGQEQGKRHVPWVEDVRQERREPQLAGPREGGGDRSVGGSRGCVGGHDAFFVSCVA